MLTSEVINTLYKDILKNSDLYKLLGSPKTPEERNERVRRDITPLYYETADKVNFLSIYSTSTTETDNMFFTRAFLNIDFFCKSIADRDKMVKLIGDITLDEDIICTSQHTIASDTKGVYRYRMVFRPLVWSQ